MKVVGRAGGQMREFLPRSVGRAPRFKVIATHVQRRGGHALRRGAVALRQRGASGNVYAKVSGNN